MPLNDIMNIKDQHDTHLHLPTHTPYTYPVVHSNSNSARLSTTHARELDPAYVIMLHLLLKSIPSINSQTNKSNSYMNTFTHACYKILNSSRQIGKIISSKTSRKFLKFANPYIHKTNSKLERRGRKMGSLQLKGPHLSPSNDRTSQLCFEY